MEAFVVFEKPMAEQFVDASNRQSAVRRYLKIHNIQDNESEFVACLASQISGVKVTDIPEQGVQITETPKPAIKGI